MTRIGLVLISLLVGSAAPAHASPGPASAPVSSGPDCQTSPGTSCAKVGNGLSTNAPTRAPSLASPFVLTGGSPSEIWIAGAWYDGGLPTNTACAPGVGGTAGGAPCWFNNAYNGYATPIVNEFSPFVVDRNPSTSLYQYLFSSADSYFCSSSVTLIQATNPATPIQCDDPTQAHNTMVISDDAHFKTPAAIPTADNYRRNYQGAPTGVVVGSGGRQIIVAASHGENKNEQLSPYVYQNGISAKQPAGVCLWPDYGTPPAGNCAAGSPEDECGQDLPWFANGTPSALCNYFGFINGNTSPALNAGNNYGEVAWADLGPIIWPAEGYLDKSGDPTSRGVRHPFLLQPGDGFLYLYYLDTTPGSWGIKVARSPEAARGAVGSWMDYDAADGRWDMPSVPRGLSISNYNNYLSTHGPAASNLWGDDGADTVPMTFQVARLTGLPGYRYIGVEESVGVATSTAATPYPYTGVTAECPAIRLSSDLVHWTPPQCIPTDSASSYVGWYPVLLSSDGSTDQAVDASGFNVVSGQDSTPYIQPVKIAAAGS